MLDQYLPREILDQIVSLLPRTEQKTLQPVSRSFSRPIVDKVIYFPLPGNEWQAKTEGEIYARAVREHALQVMSNPATASGVRELRVRTESKNPYMVPFDPAEASDVAREVQRLIKVFANAVNLQIYSCRSHSSTTSSLTSRANLLPKLQVCSVSSLSALSTVEVCHFPTLLVEDSPYISNTFDCLWTSPGPYTVHPHAKYGQIQELALGNAFNISKEPLDLSEFPALERLKLSSTERGFPFRWLQGQNIGISGLVIQGKNIRLGDEFEDFLSRLLPKKLVRLSIRVFSFDYQPSHSELSFLGLRSLELAVYRHAQTFFRHDFPSLTKVSFSTCAKDEVSDFYKDFVGSLSDHLKHILVQRRIPDGQHTALACHIGSLYEMLSEGAVDAILQCSQLRDFTLEGRVYFPTTAWERWCAHDNTRNLQRAYFARPNALVLAEDKFMLSLLSRAQNTAPSSLLSRFKKRLFLSPMASETWPETTSFDRIAVKQKLLLEIDPERDFTETCTEDQEICDANYQLAVEAARHDRCFCNPGEERFPTWFAQKRDISSDSENDSNGAQDIDPLEKQETPAESEHRFGQLVPLEYVKAVCPRSHGHNRRLRKIQRGLRESKAPREGYGAFQLSNQA